MKQLGKERFDQLIVDPEPIGSASLGQVYLARLKTAPDQKMALKVQYPGVDSAIESDLKALKRILALSRVVAGDGAFDEIFDEVKMMLQHEVDYLREAKILSCIDPY